MSDNEPRPPEPAGSDPFPAEPRFTRYEILERLGGGGMGVVYRARDRTLAREVALKVLRWERSETAEDVARFLREARTGATLDHPGVVRTLDVGEEGGVHYIVQELVRGRPLDDLLATGPIEPERAAEITLQLAQAVGHAHERGVCHRDVKPENVLLNAAGSAKLTDFGLARRAGESTLTQTGIVFGTLAYMAPEQIEGKPTTLSDLYGLGATLYEMLTARPPFGAQTRAAMVKSILFDEPIPPGQIVQKVPPDLDAICLRCLEKNPERRYPSTSALVADVLAFLAGAPVSARETGGPARWAHAKVRETPTSLLEREKDFPSSHENEALDPRSSPRPKDPPAGAAAPRSALEIEPGEGETLLCPALGETSTGYLCLEDEEPLPVAMLAARARTIPLVWDREGNHAGIRNVLFLDGHVDEIEEARFRELAVGALAATRRARGDAE